MFSFGVFSRILIKIEIECLPGSLFTPGTFLFQITCINDGLCIPLLQSSFPTSLFWIHPTYKTNLCSNIFIHLRVPSSQLLYQSYRCLHCDLLCNHCNDHMQLFRLQTSLRADVVFVLISRHHLHICVSPYPNLNGKFSICVLHSTSSLSTFPVCCNSLPWFQQLHHLFLSGSLCSPPPSVW